MNGYEFEEHSYYVVEASMSNGNPIFQDIFYTGFLTGKNNTPGGYNGLLKSTTEFHNLYYMKIIRKIDSNIDNNQRMVKDVLMSDYPEYVL